MLITKMGKKKGKDGNTTYGDWIAWAQLWEEAKKFATDQRKASRFKGLPYVIFVTGDLKDD